MSCTRATATYSTGLYSSFVAECADLGINIVETQTFTASTSTDFSTQVNALVDSGVKVVFIPFYAEEASTFLTQAKGKFADDVYFFGADGLDGILGKVEQDVTIANNVLMLTPSQLTPPKRTSSPSSRLTRPPTAQLPTSSR